MERIKEKISLLENSNSYLDKAKLGLIYLEKEMKNSKFNDEKQKYSQSIENLKWKHQEMLSSVKV